MLACEFCWANAHGELGKSAQSSCQTCAKQNNRWLPFARHNNHQWRILMTRYMYVYIPDMSNRFFLANRQPPLSPNAFWLQYSILKNSQGGMLFFPISVAPVTPSQWTNRGNAELQMCSMCGINAAQVRIPKWQGSTRYSRRIVMDNSVAEFILFVSPCEAMATMPLWGWSLPWFLFNYFPNWEAWIEIASRSFGIVPMWTATVAWLHVRETQNDRETGCPVDANMACTAMFINCSQWGYLVSRQKRI